MLGYQPRLGAPLTTIIGQPIYAPWRLLEWWYAYEAYAPDVFRKAGIFAASSGIAGTLVAIAGSLWRAWQNKLVTTYGSARWANIEELKSVKLFSGQGVFLGKLGQAYFRNDGPEHVLAFAPTRSGKGVGLVIPTLLTWPHSRSFTTSKARTGSGRLASDRRSSIACCSIPLIPRAHAMIRCSKCAKANGKSVMSRTLLTSWLILKEPLNAGTIGRKPATPFWWV